MSVLGALFSAVSGLSANSNALGIISDNISNANTVGFKETTASFSTLVTQQGSTTAYSPGGVQSSPAAHIDKQGLLQASNSNTDIAISGGGFFVVNSNAAGATGNGTSSFTRAGSFTIDANGNLKNAAGLFLQGQKLTIAQSQAVAAGNLNQLTATSVSSLQTVNVNGVGGSAAPSQNVTIAANLPATDIPGDLGRNTPGSAARTVTVPVFDSLGSEHDLTLSLVRVPGNSTATPPVAPPANRWRVTPSLTNAPNSTVTIAPGNDIIQFNSDGSLNAGASTFAQPNALSINWGSADSGGTSPQTITFNLGSANQTNGLSQFGGNFTVSRIDQDGVRLGNFTGVTIDQNGFVTANFDNGIHQAIYLLPLATFRDPDGLVAQTGNTYTASGRSGNLLLRQPGAGDAGQIAPSTLEGSTVDIATEFSNLIITQRAYEASAKTITTADQMLQDLIQTIR